MTSRKKDRTRTSLSHLNRRGHARMVDVSDKPVTPRRAVAAAEVHVNPATLKAITDGSVPKGDVFAVARVAGIQAAKRCGELIPLCHPLPIDSVEIDIAIVPPDRIRISAVVGVTGRTGVEMEALTAASVTALTIYDMCKAIDRSIEIGPIRLEEKSGGRSGAWRRERCRPM